MEWISYTLLAALAWSFVNIIDKYTLTNLVKSPIIPMSVLGIIGFLSALVTLYKTTAANFTPEELLLALIAGALYLLVMYFYYRAVKIEEISRVIPLYYLAPMFVLAESSIFLKSIPTKGQIAGILFLVVGTISLLITRKSNISNIKAGIYMILAAFVYSLNQIVTKYLLNKMSFSLVFAYGRIGLLLALIPILYKNKQLIKNEFKQLKLKTVSLISTGQFLNVVGILLITHALTIGNVSVVNGLATIQPLLVLLMTVAISQLPSNTIFEKYNYRIFKNKLFSIGLIITGVIFII